LRGNGVALWLIRDFISDTIISPRFSAKPGKSWKLRQVFYRDSVGWTRNHYSARIGNFILSTPDAGYQTRAIQICNGPMRAICNSRLTAAWEQRTALIIGKTVFLGHGFDQLDHRPTTFCQFPKYWKHERLEVGDCQRRFPLGICGRGLPKELSHDKYNLAEGSNAIQQPSVIPTIDSSTKRESKDGRHGIDGRR
jgi:hypothetical protein